MKPALIICMGVSGCGKSTLSSYLACQFELHQIEADEFHSAENRRLMSLGIGLSDRHRQPWMESVCAELKNQLSSHQACCLAHSGLRREHRAALRAIGFKTLFLHLTGSEEELLTRLNTREGHFAGPSILSSQLEALQATDNEPDVIELDAGVSLTEVKSAAMRAVETFFSFPGQLETR